MKKTIYLHIGLPKTGTTYLQRRIFPKLKDVNYVDIRHKDFLYFINPITRQPLSKLTRKEKAILKILINKKVKNKKNLISYEDFSGMWFKTNQTKNKKPSKIRTNNLNEIKSLFEDFDLKIIVALREQTDLINSLYKNYIYFGGTKDIHTFIKTHLILQKYLYCDFIDELQKVFNLDENLYVFLYEDLKKNKNEQPRPKGRGINR
jgi:hypothetical protein